MNQSIALNKKKIEMKPLGDSAVIVKFGADIQLFIHQQVKALTTHLQRDSFVGFMECVPAFTSVTVFYNPLLVKRSYANDERQSPYQIVCFLLEEILKNVEEADSGEQRIVEIPVCYGGEYGPDLPHVAEVNGLSVEEVIDLHSSGEYRVYMIGFAPGFPYLGGLSDKLATPRRSSPRLSIPAGSVGIAGSQTGVYPISTPGGWQLIGRTPVDLFQPEHKTPSLLAAGDIVKFVPITMDKYEQYRETRV